jgi:hypothetical protein
MRRKRIFLAFGLGLLVLFLGVGWVLWLEIGYFEPVAWCKQECSLSLVYLPASHGAAMLYVREDYSRGSVEPWTLFDPGATKRWLGAVRIPALEDLEAHARVPLFASPPRGLCNLYEDVGDKQKADILLDLTERSAESTAVREELQALYDTGEYPWLEQVLGE